MKETITAVINEFREFFQGGRNLVARDFRIQVPSDRICIFEGMRQTGKSSLMQLLVKNLLSKGISMDRILYINFEDSRLIGFTSLDFQILLDIFHATIPHGDNHECYFFLDGIDRVNQWESWVLQLSKMGSNRIYIAGSSSELFSSSDIKRHCTHIEIFPLSFKEFLLFSSSLDDTTVIPRAEDTAVIKKKFRAYMDLGGFPGVLGKDLPSRIKNLQDCFEAVIFKDVVERHGVSNVKALKLLAKEVMDSSGARFSVTKFYKKLQNTGIKCSRANLYDFITYLEKAFLFHRVPAHTQAKKDRSTLPYKIYTIDMGLLRAITVSKGLKNGLLLENLVFQHLRRQGYQIEYVKAPKGAEISFYARQNHTGNTHLIQVCWSLANKKESTKKIKSLADAMENMNIKNSTVVTWEDEQELNSGIRAVPIWEWMLF